ncbi:uncharacterized protein E0L32_000648 [Thyridium curvatum]|uniref:Small VCP/p97-interacting protein n=1 Tax=Thyridium curvatum TaxID=1093900 RepID=A0A507B6A9_9PEZI|nr:uncharacterized protein E0L32_000648 [Thyridium curvatum]TPX14254.1 hypothetical protein E0L32_000648 [Thyridium curvatum]
MGNCCGKSSSGDDNFQSPGRVLGSAPPPAQAGDTARVPAKATKVGGPPRTLGGGDGSAAGGGGGGTAEDARRKAAEAAEARAKGGRPVGKLGEQLAEQRKRTMSDTLKDASAEERRRREMDAAEEARAHN